VTTGRANSSVSMLQASNILLMGCNVVEGEGTGLVIATGKIMPL
jgi:magnesium-transporting ATPase (P-type)